ncbi:archaemetzincin family Zn-dependent metalloprotease [Gemmatimonadota bacterium]
MHILRIVPFSVDSPDLIPHLCLALNGILDLRIKVENIPIDFDRVYHPERNQYHSTELIRGILDHFPEKDTKILGVTSLDLFIPILTFVFGEAQLNGSVAVVSSFRLKQKFYGLPPDRNLLKIRLVKEALHELGHTYGLVHCGFFECVMHSSTSVEWIDLKKADFCPECFRKLEMGGGA